MSTKHLFANPTHRLTPLLHVLSIWLALTGLVPLLYAQERRERQLQEIQDEIQEQVDEIALHYRSRLYPDELLQGYISDLGQSLVPKETPQDILFSFRVVDDPLPNAVALPDGRIFIHSGLLTFVDNEAQLATILGHEIGHVTNRHTAQAIREARSFKRSLIRGIGEGIAAGITRRKDAAEQAGDVTEAFLAAKYARNQEDEADMVGCSLAISRGFDPGQATTFFQKLTERFGEQGRLSNFLFGTHSLNTDRAKNIQRVLDGDLSGEYNRRRSEGTLSFGSGQLRFHASAMIRDTAIVLGELYDRYDLARDRLESIQDVRARDPKTLWYLGRIYRLVARTEEDKNKALDLLQRAVEVDERGMYPEINKDLALFLMSRTGNLSAAVESLKRYIVGYTTKYGRHPRDLEQMYDYLLLFGDSNWAAPEPPRQLFALQPVREHDDQEEAPPGIVSGPSEAPAGGTTQP